MGMTSMKCNGVVVVIRFLCSIKLLRITMNNKDRASEEHRNLVEGIMKRGKMGRLKIEAAGISYECPKNMALSDPLIEAVELDSN
ncbi:hypothetical protein MKW98_029967 [Papaver atlanticum]|uniref:Uncharacterized protein n=1 Tax=Papaver atlanticum TaxID=357466 RepID=A0AAD4TNA8_9MAGN|nr:hypothetical protein MKW98_029967 [Papaver atlanticum]